LLRERLSGALKGAIDGGDERAACMLRLVLAALKERDHCARQSAAAEGISDGEIVAMLRDMVEQRRSDIPRCEETARVDQAQQETEEIAILERFLPPRMSDGQTASAVDDTIRELGATKLKDAGRVIAALKDRYNGQMDFGTAKRLLCQRLH
jgi:uncharacterized protein YqeY